MTSNTLETDRATILIVDDWRLFLKMAEDIFRREPVNILKAKCGPEAVELVRQARPDLVFMDLYMSGGNGDDACREIKTDRELKTTPVVIVTSSDSAEDIERCRQAGCDDFIHKPFTRDELLATSRKFISFPEWSGKRAKATTLVKYGLDSKLAKEGLLTDISVGGIFLRTRELLPLETQIQLEFRLSHTSLPIQCRGRVAWVKPHTGLNPQDDGTGMGIELITLRPGDRLAIQSFIAQRG